MKPHWLIVDYILEILHNFDHKEWHISKHNFKDSYTRITYWRDNQKCEIFVDSQLVNSRGIKVMHDVRWHSPTDPMVVIYYFDLYKKDSLDEMSETLKKSINEYFHPVN